MSRVPVLYLAPWVDFGGTDKATIDWFRWIDRERFAPLLVTTQPSPNRRLAEILPYAEEVWALPELFSGDRFPALIFDLVASRRVEILHIMNSRLGFDLLPDLRALPTRPRTVVQLHVEEPTHDGYVRYVTTRYGNLVDCFSVIGDHLVPVVEGYGVPRDRIEVIPLGVDAEDEFAPETVPPRPGIGTSGAIEILFVGRLVAQKDPLLMVEIAAELTERGLDFRIHVIGDGELEAEVRDAAAARGVADRVIFEPPTRNLASWYRAADLLLMTSVFEGIPLVVYEAMAMGLPVVVPDLPGNRELVADVGGTLVEERSPVAFADALVPLIRSSARRQAVGAAARSRVREHFTVREMADRHGALYGRLLKSAPPSPEASPAPQPTRRILLAPRPSRGTPGVSVITPCFNDGHWLAECVHSVRAQDYRGVEMIVVDDGSTESDTLTYLEELDASGDVTVLHLEDNAGPSAARNRGLERARGRYILPLDSDNVILPDAIGRLVAQLQGARTEVGFIYPAIQYFGNREDYFEPPAYNGWLLTQGNYIDTCSLIDRGVFDSGIRYAEDITLGHEDWDFYLQLLERGIVGEPAPGKTLRSRKQGFTRSELVDWSYGTFRREIPLRHPTLFARPEDRPGDNPQDELKAQWAPSLTLVALAPLAHDSEAAAAVLDGLARQTLGDSEMFVFCDRQIPQSSGGPAIHVLPSHLAGRQGETVDYALDECASTNLVLTTTTGAELLADPGALERLARLLEYGASSGVVAFTDAGAAGSHPWCSLPGDDPGLWIHSLAISRRHRILRPLPDQVDQGDPLGTLARWYQPRRINIEWRHLPLIAPRPAPAPGSRLVRRPTLRDAAQASERFSRMVAPTSFPGVAQAPLRWNAPGRTGELLPAWAPVEARPLVRHRQPHRHEIVVSNSLVPPEHFVCDRVLGVTHGMAFQGTGRLVRDPDVGFGIVGRGGEPDAEEMERSLGYVDQVALPLMAALMLCRHAETKQLVLVCGADDPLNQEVEWPQLAVLGWIDQLPQQPGAPIHSRETTAFLRPLVRTLDRTVGRHRAGVGLVPAGEGGWELGSVLDRDPGHGIPVWTDTEGRLHTDLYDAARFPFSPRRTADWVLAPLHWGDQLPFGSRTRASVRRGVGAVGHAHNALRGEPIPHDGQPEGWLLRDDGPERVAIVSAIHPVTSDQLITRDPSEVRELGYESPRILGYALAVSTVAGTLAHTPIRVPWADRFGEGLSLSEDPLDPESRRTDDDGN